MLIERSSMSEIVSDKILEMIVAEYDTGDRLPSESELEKMLGVGRASIREGIKRLEALGLVRVQHGKGTYVRNPEVMPILQALFTGSMLPQKKELIDLFQVRKMVEVESTRLACFNMQNDQFKRLASLLDDMEESQDNPLKFIEIDLQFHIAIAEASQNSVLPVILRVIRSLFTLQSPWVAEIPNIVEVSLRFHQDIFNALKNGDEEEAAKQMDNHLQQAMEGWIALERE